MLALNLVAPFPLFAEKGHHHHHARPEFEFLMKADRAEIIDVYFKQCDELHALRHAYNALRAGGWNRESFKNGMGAGGRINCCKFGSNFCSLLLH